MPPEKPRCKGSKSAPPRSALGAAPPATPCRLRQHRWQRRIQDRAAADEQLPGQVLPGLFAARLPLASTTTAWRPRNRRPGRGHRRRRHRRHRRRTAPGQQDRRHGYRRRHQKPAAVDQRLPPRQLRKLRVHRRRWQIRDRRPGGRLLQDRVLLQLPDARLPRPVLRRQSQPRPRQPGLVGEGDQDGYRCGNGGGGGDRGHGYRCSQRPRGGLHPGLRL